MRLSGGGEVVHQGVDDVVLARLLEVGHHDVARIGLGVGARLAHQAGRPQAQHLVLAGARLELQLHVVARTTFSKAFSRSSNVVISPAPQWRVAAGYSSPTRPFHPGPAVAESAPMPLDDLRALDRPEPDGRRLPRPLARQGPDRHPGRARSRAAHGRSPAAALALALFPRGRARLEDRSRRPRRARRLPAADRPAAPHVGRQPLQLRRRAAAPRRYRAARLDHQVDRAQERARAGRWCS